MADIIHFSNENIYIYIQISIKCVREGLVNNKSALVKVIARR